MAQTLPVSRVVNVGVILTPAGAQSQSLSDLLILGTSTVIDPTERFRSYSDLSSLAADFGTTSEEYKAASLWFQQKPQPTRVLVGRWCKLAAAGGLRCAPLTTQQQTLSNWTAVTNGGFRYQVNGAALSAISGLNFSGATNMNGVASVIDAALSGVDCIWNAALSRFEFTSQSSGPTSVVSFMQAPTVGSDISAMLGGVAGSSGAYSYSGVAAETAEEAVLLFDDRFGQQWYGITVPSATNSEQVLVAAVVEASINKHILGCTTQEAGVLVGGTTSDLASLMKAANYTRTIVQYSSKNAYAVVSAMARLLGVNYNGNNTVITLKFKQEPGIEAESLATSQVEILQAKNANVFVNYANETAILEQGVMANGEFADVITGTDWLAVSLQRALYNVLYTSTTKIPQTDQGQQLLLTTSESVCAQAVNNGLLAPGVWNSGGFGQIAQGDFLPKGYYVWSASFDQQDPADRAARRAMPIQIAAKLAGAIHDIQVTANVNQ